MENGFFEFRSGEVVKLESETRCPHWMGASSGFRLFIKAIYAIEGIANMGRIASPFLGSTTRMENTSFVGYEEDDDDHPDCILAAYWGFEIWGRIESPFLGSTTKVYFSASRRR